MTMVPSEVPVSRLERITIPERFGNAQHLQASALDAAFQAEPVRRQDALAGTSLLMDLRPCYEGFAGIPQESRLLFSTFAELGLGRFGALASGIHYSSRQNSRRRKPTPFETVIAQTEAIIAQDSKRIYWGILARATIPFFIRRRIFRPYLALSELFRSENLAIKIDSQLFEDYIWVKLFERTLLPKERKLIQRAEYFITELGHEYARALALLPKVFQRQLNGVGWDVFFASTVTPYRIQPATKMLVRYYDALPLLSPHTVGEPWPHARSHARMLKRNMDDGAIFYCDSEPVRSDLLNLFPAAENRVHTIPAMIADGYWPDVQPRERLRTILRRRVSGITSGTVPSTVTAQLPRLVMAVSTLEPRKNYLNLFRAFEIAKRIVDYPIQLLVVANPGWRSDAEVKELKALVRDGAFHLTDVPLAEMRVLYSMAHCIVAPSRAEGFGYCGVEAMACGTPVIASDIPVHRWVYGNAAKYFDPYDEEELAQLIVAFVSQPRDEGFLADLRDQGLKQAALYSRSALAPRWEEAILNVAKQPR